MLNSEIKDELFNNANFDQLVDMVFDDHDIYKKLYSKYILTEKQTPEELMGEVISLNEIRGRSKIVKKEVDEFLCIEQDIKLPPIYYQGFKSFSMKSLIQYSVQSTLLLTGIGGFSIGKLIESPICQISSVLPLGLFAYFSYEIYKNFSNDTFQKGVMNKAGNFNYDLNEITVLKNIGNNLIDRIITHEYIHCVQKHYDFELGDKKISIFLEGHAEGLSTLLNKKKYELGDEINYFNYFLHNIERLVGIYDLIAEKREVENIINTKQINREISSYAFGYTFFRLAELKYGEDVYRMALNKEKITLA